MDIVVKNIIRKGSAFATATVGGMWLFAATDVYDIGFFGRWGILIILYIIYRLILDGFDATK